jgi:hypothetical protein
VIVLDTNVLSALMQEAPDRTVMAWLDGLAAADVWTTTLTIFEVRFGIEILVDGKRRRALERGFTNALREDLGGRVLPFDERAAELAAGFAAKRRRAGRPVDMRDMQIAGIVAGRRAKLATRNQRDFADLGVRLIDPWA